MGLLVDANCLAALGCQPLPPCDGVEGWSMNISKSDGWWPLDAQDVAMFLEYYFFQKFKATFLILFIIFFRIQHLNTGWIMIKFHEKSTRSSRTGPTKSLPKIQVYNRSSPRFSGGKVSKNPPASAFYRAWQPSCTLSVDPKFCDWSCVHDLEHWPILREKNWPTLLRHIWLLSMFYPQVMKVVVENCWALNLSELLLQLIRL